MTESPQPALEFSRDDDGELLIDWSPAQGRMVTLSLRKDGLLSYAVKWDAESFNGTAQMPAAQPALDVDALSGVIMRIPCEVPAGVYMWTRDHAFRCGHRDARHAAAELLKVKPQ